MKPVEFHPDAAEEAQEAFLRYERVRVELGQQFQQELHATLDRISKNPLLYAMESGQMRIAPFHRFPFMLIYEDLMNHIWIAALAHQSRRPGYWSKRRKL